jgi:hypothetical protein
MSHGGKAGQCASPLRILLITWSPSEPRTQQRLQLLSASLRSANHTIVVCVPPDSLSLTHATEADDARVEYIFLRQHSSAFTFVLGSWITLLRRFRPNLIHVCPDLPSSLALKLADSARRRLHPPIPVLVETYSRMTHAINGAAKARGWNTDLSLWAKLYGKEATQLLCPDQETLWWYQEKLGIPAYRLSLLRREQPPPEEAIITSKVGDIEVEIESLIHVYKGVHARESKLGK